MRIFELICENPNNKPTSQELINKIKELHDEGWKDKEVAELVDLDYKKVKFILQKYYPDRANKRVMLARAITPNDKQNIVQRYLNGETGIKIGKDYGITAMSVYSIVQSIIGDEAYNQELEKRKGLSGYRKHTTPEEIAKFAELYSSGMAIIDAAKIMNIDPSTFVYHLKKLPNWAEIRQNYLKNRQTKQRGPTTTKINRAGTGGNLRGKGPYSKHTSGNLR